MRRTAGGLSIATSSRLIFLSPSADRAKLLDFGLAKLAQSTEHTLTTPEGPMTSPGSTIGTVAYMSPEQVRAEELDPRTDLFAFGSVMYEMATGDMAFSGSSNGVVFEAHSESHADHRRRT